MLIRIHMHINIHIHKHTIPICYFIINIDRRRSPHPLFITLTTPLNTSPTTPCANAQVHGLDYPYYEFSQMAPKSVFFTRNAANRRPAPPAATAVPAVADEGSSSSNNNPSRARAGGLALTTSPPPMRVKGPGLEPGPAQGPGPGLDYGVGALGDSVTSALTHNTGVASNHNNASGGVSTSPTKGAPGIKNKVLAGLMKQRTDQGQGLGKGLGPAETTADATSSHAQGPGLGLGPGVKKKSKLQELLHPTTAPAAVSRTDRQVADTADTAAGALLLSEDDEIADAADAESASPSNSPSRSRSNSQSPSKSPSKDSPSKSPSKTSASASASTNPMARIVAATANTMTLMDEEVTASSYTYHIILSYYTRLITNLITSTSAHTHLITPTHVTPSDHPRFWRSRARPRC